MFAKLVGIARALAMVMMGVAVHSSAVRAATPSSGTVTPSSSSLTFTGGPFDFTNQAGVPSVPPAPIAPPVCADPALPCDDFALTVSIPPADPNDYALKVNLGFANLNSDFDLYLMASDGITVVAASLGSTGTQESVQVPASPGTISFTVRIVPYDVTTGSGGDTYTTTVRLIPIVDPPDPPEPPDQLTVPGVPRFQNYQAPEGMGGGAAEPTLGVNFDTDKIMYIAGLQTLRVGFDDCASPGDATWEDVSFETTSQESLDPILFTDSSTNRTFVSQLAGACSLLAFTDDDGDNWTPSQGCGEPHGVDHQSVGGGPFAPDPIGPTTPYPNAVYYCSQESATAFCALSRDGGLTFGPSVPAWNLTQCGAIHGHIKVAPDGTVYVPNKDCGADPVTQGVIVSTDNGLNWTVRQVTGSTPPKNNYLVDSSLGIGALGRLYFGYQGSDGHAWIAVSGDQGVSWEHNQDVGAALGIENITFPAVVAGDNNRAAYAFLGTLSDGDYGDDQAFNAVWHLFVATTFDGGVSWTTVDATPHDPVQRGSICNKGTLDCDNTPDDRNLLDFMDVQMDRLGRIVVAYADGCITGSCIHGSANDFTAKATIARQSGGKRLLAQYDPNPAEPTAPKAPRLDLVNSRRTAPGVVHLAWSSPDNGGSPFTSFRIYRGATSGGETFLNSAGGAKSSYDDITANPATAYYYRITAVNVAGEGPFCNEILVPPGVSPGIDPCTVPGVTVSTDLSDSPPNLPANAAVDIQSLSVAEPYSGQGVDKMVFTLQVGEAASAPPSSQWYILWNRTTPDGDADRNYVAMKTDATGTPAFEYGQISPPNVNAPTRLGAADDGSYNAATGTIRITISNSSVDGVVAGQALAGMQARTFLARPDGLPVTQNACSDFSPAGIHSLVGNESCRSNDSPIAVLSGAPASGCLPLTVLLDGSSSFDPDAGDTIVTYQFDFGDGTSSVVQSSPTISHIYATGGEHGARLHVTDSRGKISQNVDLKVVEVHELPAAAAAGSATICEGSSTSLSGSGGTGCSWSPATGLSDPGSCTPVASPSSTTTYTLTVTDGNACVSVNNPTVTVTVEHAASEIGSLGWGNGKDTLSWAQDANATSYRVFRGVRAGLPNLLDSNPDSCLRFEGATTTTGPVLTEDPAAEAGRFYWYLVAGVSCQGTGPAGSATAGTHVVNSTGPCP